MRKKALRFVTGFRVALTNRRAQAAEMVIPSGGAEGSRSNRHRATDQWLYVVSGTGVALVNGRRFALRPATLVLIARRDRHQIKNTGRVPLRTLNIYVPPGYTRAGTELRAAKP